MRLQFCSNLHLNSYPETDTFDNFLLPVAKSLVLCGDIGNPTSSIVKLFFHWCHTRWDAIFWIPGFHELMDALTSEEVFHTRLNKMRKCVSSWNNIYVVHREKFYTEDGCIFLGCSLWSRILDPVILSQIPIVQTEHEKDVRWLKHEIQIADKPVVVATYMSATHQLLDDGWKVPAENVFYAADTELLIRPPVVAWISGNIHKSLQLKKEWYDTTILLVTNAKGYPGEDTGYRTEAVVRIGSV